jgi:tetratricopeptide (TPR) repeat protein
MAEETFGRALRRLRSERALTQPQLGRLVNYTGGYISDLELGKRAPHHRLAEALDDALGADGQLVDLHAAQQQAAGIPRLPDWDDARLAAGVTGTARPDPAMAGYLTQALALQRGAEDTGGARVVLIPTLGQLTAVETLRDAADGDLHRDLLSLEAQYAQFIGWCYQDLGDRAASEQWYARALMIAHEAGDDNMVASILSMRSNAAWGRGDIRRAVDLGEAATRPPGTPGVLALSHQQAARGLAAAGERRQALQALDEAARLAVQAAGDPEREPPWVYFADEDRLEVQRAIALAELGEHRQAADLFRAAIGRLPAQFVRDRGTYLARLATVLARAGELEEASATVFEARDLAAGTGSVRTLREVDRAERAIAA